jgi:hypothetical protein
VAFAASVSNHTVKLREPGLVHHRPVSPVLDEKDDVGDIYSIAVNTAPLPTSNTVASHLQTAWTLGAILLLHFGFLEFRSTFRNNDCIHRLLFRFPAHVQFEAFL